MKHFYYLPKFEEEWFDYQNLYTDMVNTFPTGSVFVEVGSWKGRSAAYMCVEIANSNKLIDFYCIDSWPYCDDDGIEVYDKFLNNLKPVEQYFKSFKLNSVDAASMFEDNSIDFVFIDAGHDYDSVRADILAWYPKVKKGGIIAGHDYFLNHPVLKDVYTVVNELFPNNHSRIETTDHTFSRAIDQTGGYCFLKYKTE